MMGTTHIAVGALAASAVAAAVGHIEITPALLMSAEFGALLPDLDSPQAMLASRIPGSFIIGGIFGHRHATHSLVAWAVVSVLAILFLRKLTGEAGDFIVYALGPGKLQAGVQQILHSFSVFMGPGAGIGLSIGYLSHLLADSFTEKGMWLFWPFYNHPVKPLGPLGFISTGGPGDTFFMVGAFLLVALYDWRAAFAAVLGVFVFWVLLGRPRIFHWRIR